MYLSCRVFFGGGVCFYEWPLCFISGSPCWLGQARVSQNYCKMFRRKMSEISEFVLSLVNGAINHTFPALFVSLVYIKYWKGRQNKVMGKMWGFCLFFLSGSCVIFDNLVLFCSVCLIFVYIFRISSFMSCWNYVWSCRALHYHTVMG